MSVETDLADAISQAFQDQLEKTDEQPAPIVDISTKIASAIMVAIGASAGSSGYTIPIGGLSHNPGDSNSYYLGIPSRTPGSNGMFRQYFRKAGTIKIAELSVYSTTAGTAEEISIYVRINNTTSYLISSVAQAANLRIFTNSQLSISVVAGDFFEIHVVPPAWATNPTGMTYGGYLYLE